MPMVDIDWLKDHVDVPENLTYEQLAKDLVRVGLEEEEIHTSQVTGPIVVGYVVDATAEPQKNGKTINWCHVDVGEKYNDVDENGNKVPRGIICGAPNMAAGEKVVVTLPGAVLPGDFKIEPRKTYGHISNGMCASERELGLGDSHNGIILLREYGFTKAEYDALKPGDDAMELLHLNKPVLEINITPDRGYAFSYRGVAREYHHSTGATYTDPAVALNEQASKVMDSEGHKSSDIEVSIEDTNPIHGVPGCDRYYARAVHDFDASSQSPRWMQRRLTRAGMRGISLAVDVTNYVMLDLGQPLHAYDLDKIEGPIVVRRAHSGEHLTTLDGKDRELHVEDLVICDSPRGNHGSRVLGLAGVMGGMYGEVTSETKNILIEAAHFDPVSIARTARRHKIPSEASRRFERGVDTQLQPAAAQMASNLLEKFANAKPSSSPLDLNNTQPRNVIVFKADEVNRVAGLDVDLNRISDILTDIGCSVAGGGNGSFSVLPPTWRPDLNEPCDLVEEIARLVGYDEIPVKVPAVPITGRTGLTAEQATRRAIAYELAETGLVESLSYPFVGEEDIKAFRQDVDEISKLSVRIANPLAGDRPWLRRSVLMTLAGTVRRNLRRGLENISMYELGHVYFNDPDAPAIPALPGSVRPSNAELAALDAGLPDQPLHVAALLTGHAEETGWLGTHRDVDWSDAVEALERVGKRIGVRFVLEQFKAADAPVSWHPGRSAKVCVIAEDSSSVNIGTVGELHPHVCEALDLPKHSAAFELDLTALFSNMLMKPVQAKPISTFPPVKQDFAFTAPISLQAKTLQDAIEKSAGDLLESVELFDVYEGEQLGEGLRSLAYSVTFRATDRTLSGEEMEEVREAITKSAAKLHATLRV
ncbi:phenylalanine--tRNA ligase subunit beta [Bifidobacteriaceae bacterium NR002]|nr:phenylalanine--tRNA ligase subunit beta [Bifidobacteriaceae bacterium NR002]MDZ7549695.1 phenylalanine--tRNA ligase subunit beta [Bifidobacteriaceae bacterium NR047]